MQITKQNFQESYQKFSDILSSPKTDFVSFDFEMSGIRTSEKESFNDSSFERYDKVGKKYAIIQAGINIVHKEDNKYVCYPFNAFIIRRKIENTNYKPDVILESGAIRFNGDHGFDFNYWIKQGISFLDREQHTTLIAEVNKRTDINPVEKQTIINKIDEAIGFTKFMELVGQRNVPIVGHNCYMDLMFLHNSFIGQLPKYYSKNFSIEEEEQKESTEGSSDSQQDEKKEHSSSNFKSNINNAFGQIYDSKAISVSFFKDFMTESNSTSLENLKAFIYSNLEVYRLAEVELAPGVFSDYDWDNPNNEQKFHEAGFDSYLTAWVFLQVRENFIQKLNKTLQDFESTFLNRVNVMTNRYFLTLGQDEDILQTQTQNGVLSDDIFRIFTHPEHNSSELEQDQIDKLQKQILEYIIAQQYTSNVRVGVQNQRYITIELNLSNKKSQEDVNALKTKLENDITFIKTLAIEISVQEYEKEIFLKKYSRNNNKKNNNFNNNGKNKSSKPYNKK